MLVCLKKKHVPDSGWCWVMLVCICVLMFLVFGVHYTYGILYPNLLKEFNQGEGKTAWVGSLSCGLMFLSSFAAIKCCEFTSVTTTSLIGCIASGLGLIFTSIIQSFESLYIVYGMLFGIGTCFLYTPCLIMIAKWFHKYQAIATGFASASGALGGVVLSPIIEYTIRTNGLRETIKTGGILYLFISLLCSLSYKPLCKYEEEREISTTEDGLFITRERSSRKEFFKLDTKLFRNKPYVVFVIVCMLTNFTYYIPLIHLVNYAKHIGIADHLGSSLISIWFACSICGRIIYGKIASNYQKYILRIYQISMFCSGCVTIAAYFSTAYWMLVCYVVLYGFLDGSFIGLLSLVTLELVGLENLPQGFGIILTSIGLPIALGPLFVGMINDMELLPPQAMFLICGIPFLIGAFLMMVVNKIRKDKFNSDIQSRDKKADCKQLISHETNV